MMILTIDPAFRNTGYAIISGDEIIEAGVIRPTENKTLQKSARDYRACVSIAFQLGGLVAAVRPDLVLFENPTGSQSARACTALGMIRGVLAGVFTMNYEKLNVAHVTPNAVKRFFDSNDKRVVQECVCAMVPSLLARPLKDREHICDAIGVYLAYSKSVLNTNPTLFGEPKPRRVAGPQM